MKALIDADIICYEFGNMRDIESTKLLTWPIVRKFVDERIDKILEETEATSYTLYLTGDNNFRKQVATILPYKGHRPEDKPPHWQNIREHLIENYDAQVVHGMEADDAVGIAQMGATLSLSTPDLKDKMPNTIICSRDKDLQMIPGWHYQWECGKQAMRKWFVDETDAIRFFYKQLLTGDATDNILGLFGVGSKAACVKALDDIDDEYEMFCHVAKHYEDRFGSWYYSALLENAMLLWIMRDGDYCQDMEHTTIDGFTHDSLHSCEIADRLLGFLKRKNHEENSKEPSNETSVQDEGSEKQGEV